MIIAGRVVQKRKHKDFFFQLASTKAFHTFSSMTINSIASNSICKTSQNFKKMMKGRTSISMLANAKIHKLMCHIVKGAVTWCASEFVIAHGPSLPVCDLLKRSRRTNKTIRKEKLDQRTELCYDFVSNAVQLLKLLMTTQPITWQCSGA